MWKITIKTLHGDFDFQLPADTSRASLLMLVRDFLEDYLTAEDLKNFTVSVIKEYL